MPPLSFSYYAHIPMVNLPGGVFVRGASDMEDNLPTWREVSPFSVSLSHVAEHEFLDVMDKSSEHKPLLQEIRDAYQSLWKRPLQSSAHPMTCVSWRDANVFCEILSKSMEPRGLGILSLLTEDQAEYAIRGPAVDVREQMEIEGIGIGDFGDWATDRFENYVTRLEMGGWILRDPKGKALKKILEGNQKLYAWRVYGTANGRLFEKKADGTIVKNAHYSGAGTTNRTREVERIWGDGNLQGTATANDRIASGEVHPFGLSDASGNVWSWCEDQNVLSWCEDQVEGGRWRRLRGGSWDYVRPTDLRSAYRYSGQPDLRYDDVGFRVAAASQDSKAKWAF